MRTNDKNSSNIAFYNMRILEYKPNGIYIRFEKEIFAALDVHDNIESAIKHWKEPATILSLSYYENVNYNIISIAILSIIKYSTHLIKSNDIISIIDSILKIYQDGITDFNGELSKKLQQYYTKCEEIYNYNIKHRKTLINNVKKDEISHISKSLNISAAELSKKAHDRINNIINIVNSMMLVNMLSVINISVIVELIQNVLLCEYTIDEINISLMNIIRPIIEKEIIKEFY